MTTGLQTDTYVDLDGRTLQLATPEQQAERWLHHFGQWGTGYSKSMFLQREAALADSAFGQTQLKMWLWLEPNGQILGSCETYASSAWYSDDKGRITPEPLQSVASVLVVPELRGQGHAAAMMTALTGELRGLGTTFSTLFSDVGANLYRRSGYLLHPATQTEVAVDLLAQQHHHTEELGLGDLADLLARDSDEQSAWLGAALAPAVTEVVEVNRIAWFATRSRFRAWSRGQEPSPVIGAAVGDSFCLWTCDAAEPTLHMLVWRPRDAEAADQLLAAAHVHAANRGLRQLEWWDANRDTGLDPWRRPAVQPRGQARTRDSGLPMLAWLDKDRAMPLIWMGIERFSWC